MEVYRILATFPALIETSARPLWQKFQSNCVKLNHSFQFGFDSEQNQHQYILKSILLSTHSYVQIKHLSQRLTVLHMHPIWRKHNILQETYIIKRLFDNIRKQSVQNGSQLSLVSYNGLICEPIDFTVNAFSSTSDDQKWWRYDI